MPVNAPKGDIRDLYAYYRFSDHKLTNIVFKDKTLSKAEVWFEGFMDWSFKKCTFNKSFYFGVSGEKLEEDTREDDFPPYGSNGLNFDTCTINKPFEIKDNCVVVFKDCTINDSVTIEDGTKVEFIDCTFAKGIIIKTYCDIRFIRCALNCTDFGLETEEHCTIEFHNCTHGSPDTFWLKATTDCSILMRSTEGTAITAKLNTIELDDYSTLKMYNYQTVVSQEGDTVTLTNNSKFESRECDVFGANEGTIFVLTDSKMFMRETVSCGCGEGGNVLRVVNSEVRGNDVGTWVAQNCYRFVGCVGVGLDIFEVIHSGKGMAILAVGSEVECRTGQTIDSAENFCVQFGEQFGENGSKGFFKDINLMQSGQSICWYAVADSWIRGENVTTIMSGESTAVYGFYARITIKNTELIQGKIFAINTDYTLIEAENVGEVISTQDTAVEFNEGTVYDLRYIVKIEGKKAGLVSSEAKGNINNIDKITSGEGKAVRIDNISGPSEWVGINDIEASLDAAMWVTGVLEGWRWVKTVNVISEQKEAIIWEQTAGDVYVADVQYIKSEIEVAIRMTVSGNLRVEDVQLVSSEEKEAWILTVSSGRTECTDIYKVFSPLADALTINISEGASLWYNDFERIESEQANALVGTVGGEAVFTEGNTVYTMQGQAAVITGNGDYSFVRFADINVFQADTPSNDLVKITSVNHVQMHRIGEFAVNTSSRYLCWLQGTGGQVGRCEVIDCPTWSGSEVRGGLYIRDFFDYDVVCSREPGTMSFEKATGIVMGFVGSNGRVANWTEVADKSGEGIAAFYIYGIASAAPGVIDVWNVDTMDGNIAARIYADGVVHLHNIGTIKAQIGDGPALEASGSGEFCLQQGSEGKTVLISKDDNTAALDIGDFTKAHIRGVETQAGQGKIAINNIKQVQFANCQLKGNIEAGQSNIELYDTDATGGWNLDGCNLHAVLSKLDIGADSGGGNLDANGSSLWFSKCEITGSSDWVTSNTDIVMLRCDGSGYSGEFEPSDGALFALGTSFGSDFDPTNSVAAFLAKCDVSSGSPTLPGATLSLLSTFGSASVPGGGAALTSIKDTFQGLTVASGTGVVMNASTVTGALDLVGGSGGMINKSTLSGGLTVSDNAGAFLNAVSVTGNLTASGSILGAEVSASSVPMSGSGIFSGLNTNPTGAGQGIVVTGDNITSYMPTKDGRNDLRTGIFMDTQMIHMWNQYGHTGYTGSGTTLALGASATGTMNAPQWAADADGQSRSGYYIVDLAAAIHHNLPGIIE